jgi:3D (Asp-Asp-Asp) domain-containing protein
MLSLCASAKGDQHKHSPRQRSLHMMRGEAKKFLALAYVGTGRMTSEGKKPIAGQTMAADPRVLPIGSKVRVHGAGAYSGVYTVSDKGGSVKGHKIDIFVRNLAEARQFGRKQVYVTVLDSAPEKATRARRAPETAVAKACNGCGRKQPNVMIAVDEVSRNSGRHAHASIGRAGASDRSGENSRGGDSRQAGDFAAIVSLPSF